MAKEANPKQPEPFVPPKVTMKEDSTPVQGDFYAEHLIRPVSRRFIIEGFIDDDVDLRSLDLAQIQATVNGRRLGTITSINVHTG